MRWVIGALGVAAGAYGAWLTLSDRSGEDLLSIGIWLIGGIIVHDVVISGLVIAAAFAGSSVLPAWAHRPFAAALVVLGSISLLAIPFLGKFGALDDNPTLLDRNYVVGYLVLAGLIALVVGVWTLLRLRQSRQATTEPTVI